jgi:hypothetical protein
MRFRRGSLRQHLGRHGKDRRSVEPRPHQIGDRVDPLDTDQVQAPVGRIERRVAVREAERLRADVLVVWIERLIPVDELNPLLEIGAVPLLPGPKVAVIGNCAQGQIAVRPFGPDALVEDEVAGHEGTWGGPFAAEAAEEPVPINMDAEKRAAAREWAIRIVSHQHSLMERNMLSHETGALLSRILAPRCEAGRWSGGSGRC